MIDQSNIEFVPDEIRCCVCQPQNAIELESLHVPVPQKISVPPRKMSLEQVIGIMRTDTAPPNDEECKKIVEEERWKKYG